MKASVPCHTSVAAKNSGRIGFGPPEMRSNARAASKFAM